MFKGLALQDTSEHKDDLWLTLTRDSFLGRLSEHKYGDYWLPFIVGFIEAACYPVLLSLGEFSIIGGWLAIKTAGNFGGWARSRATYHRFLLGTLLVLLLAFFWGTRFVRLHPEFIVAR